MQKQTKTKAMENDSQQHESKNDRTMFAWAVIENIVTVATIGLLFWFTESFLCFLLMLNLNRIRINA